MNFFVTGATGKVGSRFVPRLLQRGHSVRILVRDAQKAETLKQQGAEVIEGRLRKKRSSSSTASMAWGFMNNWHPAKRLHMVHHADVSQALLLAALTPKASMAGFITSRTMHRSPCLSCFARAGSQSGLLRTRSSQPSIHGTCWLTRHGFETS